MPHPDHPVVPVLYCFFHENLLYLHCPRERRIAMNALLWLTAVVVFLIAEACTASMVSTWFAIGGVAAIITALLGGSVGVQFAVFFVVSALSLLSLRPLVRKYISPRMVKTNVDAVSGQCGYVLEEISNDKATGRVKLGSMEWAARSASGEIIPAGTRIKADRVEGVKVFVTPAEEKELV